VLGFKPQNASGYSDGKESNRRKRKGNCRKRYMKKDYRKNEESAQSWHDAQPPSKVKRISAFLRCIETISKGKKSMLNSGRKGKQR